MTSFGESFAFGIIFISAIASTAVFVPSTFDAVGDTHEAMQEQAQRAQLTMGADITGISANCSNGTLTATLENTGDVSLDLNKTDILVSGSYIKENSVNVTVDGDDPDWDPGEQAHLNYSTVSPPVQLVVVSEYGATESMPFACPGTSDSSTSDSSTDSSSSTSSIVHFDVVDMGYFKFDRGTPGRTNETLGTTSPSRLWNTTIGGNYGTKQPIIVNNTVFVHQNGNVSALSFKNGSVLWETSIDTGSTTTPAVVGGAVFVGGSGTYIYALDEDTGNIIWKTAVNSKPQVNVITYNKTVYAGLDDGRVVALDASDGSIIWDKQISSKAYPFDTGVLATSDYIVLGDADKIYALHPGNGSVAWTGVADGYYPWGYEKGYIYHAYEDASGNHGVAKRNASDGSLVWTNAYTGDIPYPVSVGKDRVFMTEYGGELTALYKNNGTIDWSYTLSESTSESVIYSDGFVYAADMVVLNASTGNKVTSLSYSGGDTIPAIWDKSIVVATDAGYVIKEVKPKPVRYATYNSTGRALDGNGITSTFSPSASFKKFGHLARFKSSSLKYAYVNSNSDTVYIDKISGGNYNSYALSIPYANMTVAYGDHDNDSAMSYYVITKATSGNPSSRVRTARHLEEGTTSWNTISSSLDGLRGFLDVGNYTSDNYPDIVYINSNNYVAYFNTSSGSTTNTSVKSDVDGYGGMIANYDSDSELEVAIINKNSFGYYKIRLVEPDGNTTAIRDGTYESVIDAGTLGARDVDGDGDMEVIAPGSDGYMVWLDSETDDWGYIRDKDGNKIPSERGAVTYNDGQE